MLALLPRTCAAGAQQLDKLYDMPIWQTKAVAALQEETLAHYVCCSAHIFSCTAPSKCQAVASESSHDLVLNRSLRKQVTSFRVTGAEGGEGHQYSALSRCRSLLPNLTVYEHPFNEQVADLHRVLAFSAKAAVTHDARLCCPRVRTLPWTSVANWCLTVHRRLEAP